MTRKRGASVTPTAALFPSPPSEPPASASPLPAVTGELAPPSSIWTATAGTPAPSPTDPDPLSPPMSVLTSSASMRGTRNGPGLDELRALARDLVPPVGTVAVCAMTEDGAYRAAGLVDGLRRVPMGPTFTRPRDVARFVDLMEGAIK